MTPARRNQFYRWAVGAAILWYCVFAGLLIRANPGFHYDEALDVMAAVSMIHSRAEMDLPHDPDTWTCIRSRCFPLMNVRYIGPIKSYLSLPFFKVFGPRAEIFRAISVAMGAIGLIGIAWILWRQVGAGVAAAVTWMLAISPTYLDQTTFDNTSLAVWMGAMGLLLLAGSEYLDRRAPWTAFLLGFTVGFGIWMRANYLWLIAPLAVAVVVAFGRRALLPIRHWVGFVIGGILGGLPFLIYQVISRGGTWGAVGLFPNSESMRDQLRNRFVMFASTLLSDAERRIAWNGPAIPGWLLWTFPVVVLLSCAICLLIRSADARMTRACRIALISFLGLGGFLFLTRLQISEHHLTALLPLAVIVAGLAGALAITFSMPARAIVGAVALLYTGSALYWQFSTLDGLRRTGGSNLWTDGVYQLVSKLDARFSGQTVKVLDWGLMSPIYVLSDGRVHPREVFEGATVEATAQKRSWKDEIEQGGVFVLLSPNLRLFPAASEGFLRALGEATPAMQRDKVLQRSGDPYAEIIEIKPNSFGSAPQAGSGCSSVRASDTKCAGQLTGMYEIEQGWRWTKAEFSVVLFSEKQESGSLVMRVNVPAALLKSGRPVTMAIRLGGHALASETFSRAGDYTIRRRVERNWMTGEANRFDFRLDSTLTPPGDSRQLGVIFASAELE